MPPRAAKDAQMRVAQEIAWQPANGKSFKLPILVTPRLEAWRQLGLLIIGQNSNDRDKGVRKFRIVFVVLISKRNDEVAIARIAGFTQAGRDLGSGTIDDLRVERHVIVGKIDILDALRGMRSKKKREQGAESAE